MSYLAELKKRWPWGTTGHTLAQRDEAAAEVDRLRAQIADSKDLLGKGPDLLVSRKLYAQWTQQMAEGKLDTARMDWLKRHTYVQGANQRQTTIFFNVPVANSMREAIDAAIDAEKK